MDDGQDHAGPLIGWSLGTGLRRRPLEELLEFPCTFTFKAVGVARGGFVGDMLARVARVLGRAVKDDEHFVRQSSRGRYESVTLELFVQDGDEIYEIYEAMSDDARVRYLL